MSGPLAARDFLSLSDSAHARVTSTPGQDAPLALSVTRGGRMAENWFNLQLGKAHSGR